MAEERERAAFDVTGAEKVPVTLADLNTTKRESAQAQVLAEEAEAVTMNPDHCPARRMAEAGGGMTSENRRQGAL
jgi:hypothetical protein